jgi:uncharacterized protein
MKNSKPALALALLTGASTLAAAELHIPMAFEYLALNGKKVSRSAVVHKSELELSPGYHEIAIRYYDMVELDMPDTPERVSSPAFIITLNVTEDSDYYLKLARGEVVRNPLEFAEAPDVIVTRKGGGSVDYQLTHTDIEQRDFKTRLYGKTLSPEAGAQARAVAEAEAAAAAAAAAAAVSPQLVPKAGATVPQAAPSESKAQDEAASTMAEVDMTSTPVTAASASAAASPGDTAGQHAATPGDMLQLWWQRADEQTRKEFLGWAIKQL